MDFILNLKYVVFMNCRRLNAVDFNLSNHWFFTLVYYLLSWYDMVLSSNSNKRTLLYCKNVGYTSMRLQVFVAWGHQQITIIRCVMINCWSSTKISSFLMWFSLYYLLAEVFDMKIKKFQEVTHCDFNFVIVLVNLLPTKEY